MDIHLVKKKILEAIDVIYLPAASISNKHVELARVLCATPAGWMTVTTSDLSFLVVVVVVRAAAASATILIVLVALS